MAQVQESIGPDEFCAWLVFQTLEPDPALVGAAIIGAQIHNLFAEKGNQVTPADLLGIARPRSNRTDEEMERDLLAAFSSMGATFKDKE